MIPWVKEPASIEPKEFELEVKAILESLAGDLKEFRAEHRGKLEGGRGNYEIDILARFEALGVNFLVLVECKRYSSPIKREQVQILYDRIREVGANKGILFTTAGFQKGAIQYADNHGISLIQIVEGELCYHVRYSRGGGLVKPPPWAKIPKYIGYLTTINNEGSLEFSSVSLEDTKELNKILFPSQNKCLI